MKHAKRKNSDREYCIVEKIHIPDHEKRTCLQCKKFYNKKYSLDGRYKEIQRKRYVEKIKGRYIEWAKSVVGLKVRCGSIPRASEFSCVDCGKKAMCYDHRDYEKPMEISPVCVSCNKKRGPGLNRDKIREIRSRKKVAPKID